MHKHVSKKVRHRPTFVAATGELRPSPAPDILLLPRAPVPPRFMLVDYRGPLPFRCTEGQFYLRADDR
jgi:hypothetical protein